jgi:hypothetical protein
LAPTAASPVEEDAHQGVKYDVKNPNKEERETNASETEADWSAEVGREVQREGNTEGADGEGGCEERG